MAAPTPPAGGPPYVELHARSAFSFLEGASLPEDLVERAAALGQARLALTDRDGLYGAVRFHVAARAHGVGPILGAELTLGGGGPLRPGTRLVLLARTDDGYANLCRLLTKSQLGTKKGEAALPQDALDEAGGGLACLTGGYETGVLSAALAAPARPEATDEATRALAFLEDRFGENLYAEIVRHGLPSDPLREAVIDAAAARAGVPCVAAGDVHYASPDGRRLQDVLTCIRHHTSLDAAGRLLFPNGERHLRAAAEMARRFADRPADVERSAAIADGCTASLERLRYRFPDFDPPPEIDAPRTASGAVDTDALLERLVEDGAARRYRPVTGRVRAQLGHELGVIRRMGLAGYFLVVWDIVRFCEREGILCQGRGSAANSAVCYCLGITAIDPVGMELLFERFLSEERRETPDIDIDIEHARRELVIQYVYDRYGRHRAGMVDEVISYRGRSAVRDVGKALGFSLAEVDLVARSLDRRAGDLAAHLESHGYRADRGRVGHLLSLVQAIQGLPRHVGIHVGGMVIAHDDLDSVVPVEAAAMPGRSVVQWDKDDCTELGIIKIDLLGLGMLTLIRMAFELVRAHEGASLDLASLVPDDPRVYDLLCDADTVGVFQVESRAQMNTLPRMKPRTFYDLAIEVALIRPGPIQGDMVHPFLRRRRGEETVSYLHPSLEPILRRTLGVPLFQEQGMKVAVAAAGFTPAQADALRRAMGFRRKTSEMSEIGAALVRGMRERGIAPGVQERIIAQITAFSSYGFPESHALSFALIVYASAWLKVHHPAAFYAALLNAQPMGFYAPATVVGDAIRHGVPVRPIDVGRSAFACTLEPLDLDRAADLGRTPGGHPRVEAPSHAVRLGLRYVRGIGEAHEAPLGRAIAAGPFTSLEDFARRTRLGARIVGRIAATGGFRGLGLSRREAMWRAAAVARSDGPLVEDAPGPADDGVRLPPMRADERLAADHATTGLTTERHPMTLLRAEARRRRALTARELQAVPAGRRVRVAGQVIVRQRPGTARGMVFLTLEDETGMASVAVYPAVYERYRRLVRDAVFLLVEGEVEREDEVVSVSARRVSPLGEGSLPAARSRDFH